MGSGRCDEVETARARGVLAKPERCPQCRGARPHHKMTCGDERARLDGWVLRAEKAERERDALAALFPRRDRFAECPGCKALQLVERAYVAARFVCGCGVASTVVEVEEFGARLAREGG